MGSAYRSGWTLVLPVFCLAFSLTALACRSPNGGADISGSVIVSDCDDPPSELGQVRVDTVFAQPLKDPMEGTGVHRLNIRMQHGSELFYLTDGLTLQILDVAKVQALGMAPIEVGPDKLVRGQLELFFSCPFSESVGVATGTMQFSVPLTDDYGSRLAGTFSLSLTDGRGTNTFNGSVNGSFDFVLERGQPAQRFP